MHARILPRLDLRLRPIDAVDLRFAGGQLAEIVVFGGVFQPLDEVVALKVVADFPVPALGLGAGKHAANGAGAALFDQRYLLLADALLQDIFRVDLRHRIVAGGQLAADLFDLAADVLFQRQKHVAVVRQCLAQLAFDVNDRLRNIVDD